MRTTVLLAIKDDSTKVFDAITSVTENNTKPTNVCIINNIDLNEPTKEILKSFLTRQCCDKSPHIEEIKNGCSVIRKKINDINFINIETTEKDEFSMKAEAFNLLHNDTDIFFTISPNIKYHKDLIYRFLKKYEDPLIGAVYADHKSNGTANCMSSIYNYMTHEVQIQEISFRSSIFNSSPFQDDNSRIIVRAYEKSIVSHIPELLTLT